MTAPAQIPSEPYPHVSAAFINAIAEGGTKDEAVRWLQLKWNESCALRAHAESAERDYHTLEEKFDSLTKDFVEAMTEKGEAERKLAEAVTLIRELTILYGHSFIPSTMKKIDEVTK